MSFQVKNDKLLLEQYDKILEPQVSNITEKLIDTQPVFKKIYLKSKLKYYERANKKYFLNKKNIARKCQCIM